ncbi:type IV secretion protein Rhs [Scandinavium goeteborgense]|nr:type IV secretion protein Rhs [Scandinavium goeteborgense]
MAGNTSTGSKEGTLRLLTPGEISLAKTVFRSSIDYHKVWIHHSSYLPFDLQDEHTAMTPNGELYFKHCYKEDFSEEAPFLQNLFIHEMTHVWQLKNGMNVKFRGLVSWLVSYRYRLDGRLLYEYPMEQQAQIIADNFTLQNEGYRGWCNLIISQVVALDGDISESSVRKRYATALRGFPWS